MNRPEMVDDLAWFFTHAYICDLNEKQTLPQKIVQVTKKYFVIHLDTPKIQFLKCSRTSFEIVIYAPIILNKFVLEPRNITQQGGSSPFS